MEWERKNMETVKVTLNDMESFAAATAHIPDTLGAEGMDANATTNEPETRSPVGGVFTADLIRTTLEEVSKMVAKAIKGGEFWKLQSEECNSLANVWHPILAPLWEKWCGNASGELMLALMVTAASMIPRVVQEMERRASQMASTVMEKSGESQRSSGLPAAENLPNPTDWYPTPGASSSGFPQQSNL